MELENQIGQMAENVKSIKDDTTNAIADLKADIKVTRDELQNQIDAAVVARKQAETKTTKFMDEVIMEKLDGQMGEMENQMKKNGKFRMDLSDVKTMTLSGNLGGDPVATYAVNQAIYPSQKINFRDLVPTVRSATGLYVFYQENIADETNNINWQTEGDDKAQNNYFLTEVKVVSEYLAGFSTFSKQMLKSLPFLTQTLPRMLQRDFFKAENYQFFNTVSGSASGVTTVTGSDYLGQLVDLIANQKTANFNASYILVSESNMANILKNTISAGYYAGSGSVVVGPNGGITIWGVPVISASWVANGKALVIDRDYIERVEVESLAIEFSYENGTNFQKNLVTARIECQEEINLMLNSSAIYASLLD